MPTANVPAGFADLSAGLCARRNLSRTVEAYPADAMVADIKVLGAEATRPNLSTINTVIANLS
jgi:hypothetical protein